MLKNFVLQLITPKRKINKEIRSDTDTGAVKLLQQHISNNPEKFQELKDTSCDVKVFCRETKANSKHRIDL